MFSFVTCTLLLYIRRFAQSKVTNIYSCTFLAYVFKGYTIQGHKYLLLLLLSYDLVLVNFSLYGLKLGSNFILCHQTIPFSSTGCWKNYSFFTKWCLYHCRQLTDYKFNVFFLDSYFYSAPLRLLDSNSRKKQFHFMLIHCMVITTSYFSPIMYTEFAISVNNAI